MEKNNTNPGKTIRDILFAPIGCLLQITNPIIFLLFSALVLGLSALLFPDLIAEIFSGVSGKRAIFSQNYSTVTYENTDTRWDITYEFSKDTVFTGSVRHATVINSFQFPLLSHDILVTTGDFANYDLVSTSVSNHHFRWYSQMSPKPRGTINLLHTVPETPEIESALNKIKNGDLVTITGREISRISKIDDDIESSYWHDTGCNTLLVTSVTIQTPEK